MWFTRLDYLTCSPDKRTIYRMLQHTKTSITVHATSIKGQGEFQSSQDKRICATAAVGRRSAENGHSSEAHKQLMPRQSKIWFLSLELSLPQRRSDHWLGPTLIMPGYTPILMLIS